MEEQQLRKIIEKAIEKYNKYRSLEATVNLISLDEKFFKIEFIGSFCRTCGFYDYFDDFKILLEDFGLKTEIVEILEKIEGAVVKFTVKSP